MIKGGKRQHLASSGRMLVSVSALVAGMPAIAQTAAEQAAAPNPPAATAAAPTNDQGSLEEIIVTAQRRSENLQKVPISISAVTANTLKDTGIDSTAGISQIVPSVQFTRSGPSGLFFVRGVGTTNGVAGEEGSSAFYIDNIYLPDLGQAINNFNNIERIEALKGPQGTLFGRNAFGGLVHIITREPGQELKVSAEAGYGNYQTAEGKLYVGGPLGEKVSADIALTGQKQSDGWGRNLTRNEDNAKQDYWGARSKVVLRASDSAKITLSGDYYWTKDSTAIGWRLAQGFVGTGGTTAPDDWDTKSDHKPFTKQKIYGVGLTGDFDLGFAKLTTIGAYRHSTTISAIDVDAGPIPLLNIDYTSGSDSKQAEVRLASEKSEPFGWQVGGFYLNSTADNASLFSGSAFTSGGVRDQFIDATMKTNSYAVFGEANYSITPTTHLIGGIRYTKDIRKLTGSVVNTLLGGLALTTPASGKISYGEITYRAAIRQDITPAINIYASINRGFKAGLYNLQSPTNPPAQPMFITAYEAGIKSELFDRKLRLNLAGFHYNISDYQIRSLAGSATGSSVLLNAATVKVDGAEAEFDAVPTRNLRFFGGFTWLNARYGKFGGPGAVYQAPFSYPIPAVCDTPATFDSNPGVVTGPPTGGVRSCFGNASGNQVALAPKFVVSVGSSVTVPLHDDSALQFSGLINHNSGYPFEPDNFIRQGAFWLVNGSIAFKFNKNISAEVWGKNLSNSKWLATVNSTGTGPYVMLSPPRTFGVRLKYDY